MKKTNLIKKVKMRIWIKRVLKKYNYPPEKHDEIVITILNQAKQMANDFTENVN